MYLIVGLGNPENQYSKTRHNMGFDTINKIASSYNIDINKNKFKAEYGTGIYDDMDLDPGNIKVRIKGGPGSHNGMKSVVSNINSEDFVRVRVGIGKPENKSDMINYVIGHVSEDEYKILEEGTSLAKDATIEIIKNDVNSSMNKFNAKTR